MGNSQDFTRTSGERVHNTRQRWLIESPESFDTEEEKRECLSPPSQLEGTMLLSCLTDLKSAKPSICAESMSCLVNNSPACTLCVLSFVGLDLQTTVKGSLENIDTTS